LRAGTGGSPFNIAWLRDPAAGQFHIEVFTDMTYSQYYSGCLSICGELNVCADCLLT
jgi:hypothetical protein